MGNINFSVSQINDAISKIVRGIYVGLISLTSQQTTSLVVANNYYPISGVFSDNALDNGFITNSNGVLTYTGTTPAKFLVVGTSDCSVSKGCKLTYGLFKNGTLLSGAETPHDFVATAKSQNISISTIIALNTSDTIRVHSKSDQVSTDLSIQTMSLTFTEL
jgi:hypothetical protein